MSSDQIASSKTPKWFDNQFQKTKLHPGTYIGIVKNTNDPERLGRLQVWLPELGGAEDDTRNWTIVRYASPFMGSTNTPNPLASKSKSAKFSAISQTYGFWAVPPDVGNQVLITFVNGDRNKGFWFACVLDRSGHGMLPGNPGGTLGDGAFATQDIESQALKGIVSALGADANLPLAEFNRYDNDNAESPLTRKKVVHEFLAPIYINQGLAKDLVRGPPRSSAQRDMPSSVFGMSTPGAPANRAGADVYGRQGGHSFVMYDGDYSGFGKQIRLRSSGGHQILMDDVEGCVYVINSEGSAWVELSRNGSINMYGSSSMSVRTRGNFNLHSDAKVKIYGEKGIEMFTAGKMILEGKESIGITGGGDLTLFGDQKLILMSQKGQIQLDAKGDITLHSTLGVKAQGDKTGFDRVYQNTPPPPKPPDGITTYDHDDVVYTGGLWTTRKMSAKSTVPVFPTHEPWNREGYDEITNTSGNNATSGPAPRPNNVSGGSLTTKASISGTGTSSLSDSFTARYPGVAKAQSEPLDPKSEPKTNSFNKSNVPKAAAKIPGMSQSDMEDFKAGLAIRESGGDPYNTGNDTRMINKYGYAGRYQFGASALETLGYLKPGTASLYGNNGALYRKDIWTGKDGMKDMSAFLSNPVTQDAASCGLAKMNYKQLVASGVIDADSPPEHIAGMLTTAHLLGAQGAINWAKTGIGRDANSTSGSSYYASGRNAVVNNISKNYK
jgi:hypothetical protein